MQNLRPFLRFGSVLPLLLGILSLQAQGPELEPNSAATAKRLNETLSRAGFPNLHVGDGKGQVGVALNEGAAKAAAASADPIRSPLSAEAAAALGDIDEKQAAHARGITAVQAEELHNDRGLAYAEILTLPDAALRRALFEMTREAGDHPEEAMRYEESFKVTEFGKPKPADIERARRQAQALPLNQRLLPADAAVARQRGASLVALDAAVTPTSWTAKGPGNIGGRIRAMAIHPTIAGKMWIGSVGGGIWTTSNAGVSWSPVNDFMSNLAVSCLVINPVTPNTMYAGTGEGFYNVDGIRGAGIYKSTDGGVTWAQLGATANTNFLYVQSLSISPDGASILAATSTDIFGSNYIYRSTDGGATWSVVYTAGGRIGHVEYHPTDNTKAIASGYNHLTLLSTSGGASWVSATTGQTGGTGYAGGRVEVRYARSSPTTVYAAYDYGTASQLYKSTDGGVNYTKVFDNSTTFHWLSNQGWYANALWVSPVNPSVVIVGGLDLYRSTNDGTSFTKISNWTNSPTSAHADHHGIVSDPSYNGSTNNTVYFTNDGGIYKAANASTVTTNSGWQELNNQLSITQFFGAGVNPTTGTIVAGAQDNGTLRYTTAAGTENWSTMSGGDGGYCAADQTNPAYFYGEYVYLEMYRSTDSGASASDIYSGITDAGSNAQFIAPFILDPNNQATLLAGGLSLWRTVNARATTVSWSSIKGANGTNTITAIAVAPGSSDQIWVGYSNGNVYKTVNGTAVTPTWTLANTGLPARRVTRFAIDPTNSSRVYVTFGGYSAGNVWQTTNGGASWANATGTLPSAPVYGLAINPSTPQNIYAGTDVGVFASDNGGATWSGTNVGPTLASVQEIFVNNGNLVAVTHGRGVFATSLPIADTTPPTLTIAPSDNTATNASPVTFHLDWSEAVTGFIVGDVTVSGGTAQTLIGSGANYLLTVAPAGSASTVSVSVAAGAAQDLAGNANVVGASASVAYNAQSPFLYATNFDGAVAPTGWAANGDWQWGVPTSGPNADHTGSAGKVYATLLAGNYSVNGSQYLTTPVVNLPASGLPYRMRFWMWMSAESAYDGGNVEISVNGGAFNVVPSAALSVPYNDSAIASMPGQVGWSGATYAAWTRVRMNLAAYAGSGVQFRFHFTSDTTVVFPGWYIDDFTVEQDPVVTMTSPDAVAVDGGNNATVTLGLAPAAPAPLSLGYTVAGTAVNGTDYTLLSGVASAPAGAQSSTITVAPIDRGGARAKTQTVVLALANGVDYTVGSPNTATVYIAGEAGYDAWRGAHFPGADFTNDAISGPAADPEKDGISNALEYSLGLDPTKADAAGLPKPTIVNVSGADYLSLTVLKPHASPDLTYAGQVSGDLIAWDGSGAAVQTTVQANVPAGFDTITYRDTTPLNSASGNHRYLRLVVTQN